MERLKTLYHICLQGNATPAETLELRHLLTNPENKELAAKLMREAFATYKTTLEDISPDAAATVLQVIFNTENSPMQAIGQSPSRTPTPAVSPLFPTSNSKLPAHYVHFLKTAWFRYAAVLLLIVGTATFLYLNNHPQQPIAQTASTEKLDILPGTNKAVLTLADGSTILLDSAADGQLARQGNTKVLKLNAGSLAYQQGSGDKEVVYNTLHTPRGGQYHVKLPDGTAVWLNAASSLKFPVSFPANERVVEVSGEAYFEVAPDKNKPFFVKSTQTKIQVLGTSFNMNAYEDEISEKTTLLTGSIKVIGKNTAVLLSPGEQAIAKDDIQVVKNANIEQTLAWKNGLFNFQDKNLREVMRQLSRWYNIDVVYEKGVKDIYFVGEMTRNENLEFVLKTLQRFGVHFRMEEGKRLVVMP